MGERMKAIILLLLILSVTGCTESSFTSCNNKCMYLNNGCGYYLFGSIDNRSYSCGENDSQALEIINATKHKCFDECKGSK